MSFLKENKILQLKSNIFDIAFIESDEVNYVQLFNDLIKTIKQFLKSTEVSLFSYDEWKQAFFIEFSTDEQKIGNMIPIDQGQLLKENNFDKINFREIPIPSLKTYDIYFPFVKEGEIKSGILIKGLIPNQYDHLSDDFLTTAGKQIITYIKSTSTLARIAHEDKRYRQLYRVTSKFHSSMDMNDVLGEIIETLQEVYPFCTHHLLLSQDIECDSDLPVKDLQYNHENITAMQTYLTGEVQIEPDLSGTETVLYAPLKGKQGVYGLLQVNAANAKSFPDNEVNFIELLANTGGSALENAQLYHQSKRLIADLQLINETSHHLNENLRLTEAITYICGQITTSFDADEVGFILFAPEERHVLTGSTDFFFVDDSQMYIEFMSEKVKKEKDSVFIGDLGLQLKDVDNLTYRSIMGVPMIESDSLKGFAIVLHRNPYHFTFESFKLLQSLIHHSTLAISNSMLHEELEKMVITDHLTKLYSRNYLDEMLTKSMRDDAYGTFILLDIDDFKKINDTFGHQVGDDVLIQVAKVVKGNIRDGDIGARWGGEELAVYLPRIDYNAGIEVANRLLKKIAVNTNPKVTVSIGISYWDTDNADTVTELFQRADNALYEAKRSGKNRYIFQGKAVTN